MIYHVIGIFISDNENIIKKQLQIYNCCGSLIYIKSYQRRASLMTNLKNMQINNSTSSDSTVLPSS